MHSFQSTHMYMEMSQLISLVVVAHVTPEHSLIESSVIQVDSLLNHMLDLGVNTLSFIK